jgi:type IV pilus assembly protein PilO
MNWLNQLKQLNFRDIGGWPLTFKLAGLVALLVLIVVGAFWFDWRPQLAEWDTAKQQEEQLKQTFEQKKSLAVNLEAYEKQLAEIERAFGTLLKQLPKKSEMDALITDINQAGLSRGLQFELFKPATQETLTEFYAELPVTIRVTGGYHELGEFASDVAKLPRIVVLNDVGIGSAQSKDKEGMLVMDTVAKTYRYLTDEELSAQQKARKEKDKQQKKGGQK